MHTYWIIAWILFGIIGASILLYAEATEQRPTNGKYVIPFNTIISTVLVGMIFGFISFLFAFSECYNLEIGNGKVEIKRKRSIYPLGDYHEKNPNSHRLPNR